MKIFVLPIKCQGIKTKLAPWIQDSVSLSDETYWIEPFMTFRKKIREILFNPCQKIAFELNL